MGSTKTDPVEVIIADALDRAGIDWVDENDPRSLGLDFFLPSFGVHIEAKRMHSERTGQQMKRSANIIVVQGLEAAKAFAAMLGSAK